MEGDPELTRRLFEDAVQEQPQIQAYLYTTFGVRPEDLFLRALEPGHPAPGRGRAGHPGGGRRGALSHADLPGGLHLRVVALPSKLARETCRSCTRWIRAWPAT